MAEKIPPVDELQRAFLRAIYDAYHAQSNWPTMPELHRAMAQDGELAIYEAGQNIDSHYVLPHVDGRGGVALRLLGIREGRGSCEETDDFVAIVQLAARRYTEKGAEPRITDGELADIGISAGRLKRFDMLLERSHFLAGPQGTPEAIYYEVREGIGAYLTATTLDDVIAAFLKAQEGRDPRFGLPLTPAATPEVDRRRIFVVHGRNTHAQKAITELLKAFGLQPVLFRDVLPQTGKATPYVGDVLEKGFDSTYASVIVMTPDDEAQLRSGLTRPKDPDYERRPTGQARPNVLFEAGMGWSAHRGRAVILHLGSLRPLTDLEGLHVLHFDDTGGMRQELGRRLQTVGCPVDFSGDFLTAGDFASAMAAPEHQPTPQPATLPKPPWDESWVSEQCTAAQGWRQSNRGIRSYMEAVFGTEPTLAKNLAELRSAAEQAQVTTLGSSLAIVIPHGEGAPKPTAYGINAKYAGDHFAAYWSLAKNGSGYLMHTNFEEQLFEDTIAVDTRILRVTELLMHVRNLYTALGVPDSSSVFLDVRHGGLSGRALRFANTSRVDMRLLMQPIRTTADTSGHLLEVKLHELRGDLRPYVKAILNRLFELFEFYEPASIVYDELVPAFVEGRVA